MIRLRFRSTGTSRFQAQGISGTGMLTGDRYSATDITQDHFTRTSTKGQSSVTFLNNFRIIGQGPGNNFVLHQDFHVTYNAKGVLATTHTNFSVACK
jgi:hypothetical protein